MENYHKHTSFSNIFAPFKDSAMTYDDYAKRATELGQKTLTSVEHGFQGPWLQVCDIAKKYNLKFIYGSEAYWVLDNSPELADKSNAHIVILARNIDGIHEINTLLSDANEFGFYRVPRVDINGLKKLTPENVLITTACVAFWGKVNKETQDVDFHYGSMERILDAFRELRTYFGESLYLEVQYHNTLWQKTVNKLILELHYKYRIPLIAGLDSHYVYPHQKEERKWLREESGVRMQDEDHEFNEEVYEDYPDEETVYKRFSVQGVLSEDEISEAIKNTEIVLTFSDIELDKSRKIPTIYPELTQEQRNKKYLDKVWDSWERNKDSILDNARYLYQEYLKMGMDKDNLIEPTEKNYEDAITYETGIVTSTNTSDYFLLDSEMIALGIKKGGLVTPTARGSASSFFTNTLLGLPTIDRLSLPVKLYPERFVTKERLESSLPD